MAFNPAALGGFAGTLVNSKKSAPTPQFDPFQDVQRAQDTMRESVEGYGEAMRPHLMREIGNALGGLNSIGALRSGGTTTALNDITTNYAQQIGAFAKQATGDAVGYGMEGSRLRLQNRGLDIEEKKRKDAKRAGLMSAIGSVLGAGVGFIAGGPIGAVAGAKIGGSIAPDDPGGYYG